MSFSKKMGVVSIFGVLTMMMLFGYTNCGKSVSFSSTESSIVGPQDFSASITVGAVGTNPPLDLFFIVDNSASMYQHQINLGQAFANIFESNSSSLSNFNVNVYLFSTASTMNPAFYAQIPTTSPGNIFSVPAANDSASQMAMPGSIYGIWNNVTGVYGTAPFTAQFYPAAVLGSDADHNITPALYLPKKGNQSDQEYQASINALTQNFQNRLAVLNPSNQIGYSQLSASTDVSSGLCTMARLAKHGVDLNFIQPGDSSAFILVSDDNDRLNVRNANNNQCAESIVGSAELQDGTCAHYASSFNYNSSDNIVYQNDSKFTYKSGTNVAYSYPSTASCQIQYNNGYNYTYIYTALNTTVNYTKCLQMADGFCVKSAAASAALAGNLMNADGSCLASVSSQVASPAPGSSFTCAANNQANQHGAAGIDANSNGSSCSAQLVAQLSSDATKQLNSCQIGAISSTTKTVAGQALNSCPSFCASNSSSYPNCSLLGATVNRASGTLRIAGVGLTCASQCPVSGACGTGTISSYIASTYGAQATCGSSSDVISTIVVNAGARSDGSKLACANPLTNLTVKNSSNQVVCAGAASISACIESLQVGAGTSCAAASGDSTTVTAALNVNCATTCANSQGLCDPAQYSTVAQYIAQSKAGYCASASVGGAKTLNLAFVPSVAPTASCSSKCSDTLNGSCDGLGFGASDNSTVSDYINQKLAGGTTCVASTAAVAGATVIHAPAGNVASVCTDPNTFFKPTGNAYASTQTNYVAGSSSHTAADLINYIKSTLGTASSVAVIGHLAGDSNLAGTDVGSDYLNLASAMNSNQVSSINGDYSAALSDISNFIVQKSQNSFALAVNSKSVVYGVSIQRKGASSWQPIAAGLWSFSGATLVVNPSVGLQVGDQIMYQYH